MTEIIVALIVGAATGLPATISALSARKETRRNFAANGQGTLVEMIERIDIRTERVEGGLDRVERRHEEHLRRHDREDREAVRSRGAIQASLDTSAARDRRQDQTEGENQ